MSTQFFLCSKVCPTCGAKRFMTVIGRRQNAGNGNMVFKFENEIDLDKIEEDVVIVDEYGRTYTKGEFIDILTECKEKS